MVSMTGDLYTDYNSPKSDSQFGTLHLDEFKRQKVPCGRIIAAGCLFVMGDLHLGIDFFFAHLAKKKVNDTS